jgi:putative hydrolase of the HAD superfamily
VNTLPITAVVFDYGCVLSLAPGLEDFEPLRKALAVEAAALQDAYWRNRHLYDLDAIDAPTYWQGVAAAAGTRFDPDRVSHIAQLDIQMWERPNPPMIEWVRVLRAQGFRTAVVSNMSRTVGDYLRRTAKWLELFDYLAFSGELRLAKPDPAIFEECLKALQVPASRTLFVDDLEVNIAAARAVGMKGIVFRSVEALQSDLEPYGLSASLAEARGRVGSQG